MGLESKDILVGPANRKCYDLIAYPKTDQLKIEKKVKRILEILTNCVSGDFTGSK